MVPVNLELEDSVFGTNEDSRQRSRANRSPPSKIHFVSALPKTRNAKVMRRVIRSAYLGEDPGDLSALENLRAVEEIGKAGT